MKIARIQASVTQEYLAEKVKISTTHLSNVEWGTTMVGLKVIVGISKALHVSLDMLLCNEVGTPYQKPILNGKLAELLENCDARELMVLGEISDTKNKQEKFDYLYAEFYRYSYKVAFNVIHVAK